MTGSSAPFVREERYIVIKRKNLSERQEQDLREGMRLRGIGTVECVVVESDWPEHEMVWAIIENRCKGRSATDPVEIRDRAAEAIADVLGIDIHEECGDPDGDNHGCDSSTCPGALTEDHDSEEHRDRIYRMADAALQAVAAQDLKIARLEDALDRALGQICNREARAQEIREWVEADIGTAWRCERCGHSTYHQNATECADCGEDMPFSHVMAFKLGATATESAEFIASVAEDMGLGDRATQYALTRADLIQAQVSKR